MAPYSAMEIASLFIQLANSLPNDQIDNLKLNKLCYFAQGWHLARFGKPLFTDEIQAWDYGPLVKDVYYTYRVCGRNPIMEPVNYFDEDQLTSDEMTVLTDTYMAYGKYTSSALIDITHEKGTPWDTVYERGKNNIIPETLIMDYFRHTGEAKETDFAYTPEHIVTGIEKKVKNYEPF